MYVMKVVCMTNAVRLDQTVKMSKCQANASCINSFYYLIHC